MLAEHGKMARGYPDVRANTVASFALGDYEWMLAFEADELHRIVDLMRELRASTARRHVREEVPFYTGVRKPVAELVADLADLPATRPPDDTPAREPGHCRPPDEHPGQGPPPAAAGACQMSRRKPPAPAPRVDPQASGCRRMLTLLMQ